MGTAQLWEQQLRRPPAGSWRPSCRWPLTCAGHCPPSRRSLGATSFRLAAALNPGAGIRGRAPLRIGPVVNRLCGRRGFVGSSGCAQGGLLAVPCSHWFGAVSLGTWRRWRPGLLPAVPAATGNRWGPGWAVQRDERASGSRE